MQDFPLIRYDHPLHDLSLQVSVTNISISLPFIFVSDAGQGKGGETGPSTKTMQICVNLKAKYYLALDVVTLRAI